MKLTKAEWAVIAVTALTLVAMFFYFLGSQSASGPVAFSPRESESPAASAPQPSPSAEAPLEPEDGESGESETPEADPFPIDLNTATAEELMLLPGIGETRAKAIVDYREEHGPFQYVEHIVGVPGIGEGILADIMDYVTVSGGTEHGEDPGGG